MPLTTIALPTSKVVKAATHLCHVEVESVLLPKLESISSLDDYIQILKAFYGYFTPLEQSITSFVDESLLPDIDQRRKTSAILQDLQSLGFSGELKLCRNLPVITNEAAAIGAMYVLEGSTLGGRAISNMLLNNPQLDIELDAVNFFSGYKNKTGEMWLTFVSLLDQQTDVEEIVNSANDTFTYLKGWLAESL